MPQLVRGGKYVFGWSPVGEDGGITVPPEACREYRLGPGEKVFLLPGSRTSGGFSIVRESVLEHSKLAFFLSASPDPAGFNVKEGEVFTVKGKNLAWCSLRPGGRLALPLRTLEIYGIRPGYRLLCGRGSGLGPAMICRGLIVSEAEKHPEIEVFPPV